MLRPKSSVNTSYLTIIENFDGREVHKIKSTDHILDVDFIIEIEKRLIVKNVVYLSLKSYTKQLTKNREKRLDDNVFIKFSIKFRRNSGC
jgi:hypothetical protein